MKKNTKPSVKASQTYRSNAATISDKTALLNLADKLDFPPSAVSMDECGCLSIRGRSATVYCHSDHSRFLGGYLVVVRGNIRQWAGKLGASVRQDGTGEGVLLVGENVPVKPLRELLLSR